MNPVRILPALVVSLIAMLGVRGVELWTGLSTIGTAQAQEAQEASASAAAGTTGAVDAAAPTSANATPPVNTAPVTNVAAPQLLAAPPSSAPMDTHVPSLGNQTPADPPRPTQAANATAAPAPQPVSKPRARIPGEQDFMSASEIEVLTSLTKRREELDKREAELDMRDKLLRATEQRLGQKLTEIKAVEARIQTVVQTLDEKQQKQIASLVKVYETMKPKDAAQIMQDLDRTILLEVAARMKEAKMAPILAAMDPAKARDITVMLAKRNEVPGSG